MRTSSITEKNRWIKDRKPELDKFAEGSEENVHLDSFRATLEAINWKTPVKYGIHGFGFTKFMSIQTHWLAIEWMFIRSQHTRKVDEGKKNIDPERDTWTNHSFYLQAKKCLSKMYKIPTTKIREKNQLFTCMSRALSGETETMPQGLLCQLG